MDMQELRSAFRIVLLKPWSSENFEDRGVGGMIILKCVFKKRDKRKREKVFVSE